MHNVLTLGLLPSPLLHPLGPRQQPLHLLPRSRPKDLALCAQVSLGSGADGWGDSGPRLGWGSEQNPGQASETLDSSPGAGPTSKLISEGRVLKINERLKKARSPQATGECWLGRRPQWRRSRRGPGSHPLGGQEAGRALGPGQLSQEGVPSPGPHHHPHHCTWANPAKGLLNPFPAVLQ